MFRIVVGIGDAQLPYAQGRRLSLLLRRTEDHPDDHRPKAVYSDAATFLRTCRIGELGKELAVINTRLSLWIFYVLNQCKWITQCLLQADLCPCCFPLKTTTLTEV